MASPQPAVRKSDAAVRAEAATLLMESGKPVLVQSEVTLGRTTANNFVLTSDQMAAAYFDKVAFNGNPPKKGQRFGLVVFQLNGK